jgi:hypothetical protein
VLQQKIQKKGNQVEVEFAEFQRAEIHSSHFCEGSTQRSVWICMAAIRGEREMEVEQIGVLVSWIFQGGRVTGSIFVQNYVFLYGPNNNKIN